MTTFITPRVVSVFFLVFGVSAQPLRKPHVIQYLVESKAGVPASMQITEAVRSDGATMMEALPIEGNAGWRPIRDQFLPAQRSVVSVDPEAELILRQPMTERQVRERTSPVPSDCAAAFLCHDQCPPATPRPAMRSVHAIPATYKRCGLGKPLNPPTSKAA